MKCYIGHWDIWFYYMIGLILIIKNTNVSLFTIFRNEKLGMYIPCSSNFKLILKIPFFDKIDDGR